MALRLSALHIYNRRITMHIELLEERGNNLFKSELGGLCFIAELGKGNWLYMYYHPLNSPSFGMFTKSATEEEIKALIKKDCGGWSAVACQFPELADGGLVIEE
jgi:hypothetical protein